ncbi:MAG: ribosome-associated translation inhibitor RaiA [Candidatus Omnitrophica bacterium]|nr:ribosome-associated translation inhibitor RaiA [Candidatus Omnitrophota bacterium]
MDIRITGKHLSVTEGMKEHLTEKLGKLDKYSPKIVEAHVILKKEKYLHEAEITLTAKNLRAFGQGKSKENIFTAMDQAYSRIEKQLKKFREKVKDHHKKRGPVPVREEVDVPQRILEEGVALADSKPEIIRSPSFAPKPMSVEEASMQLELSSEPFLVFRDPTSERVHVIFKRTDGNHGLVEPMV